MNSMKKYLYYNYNVCDVEFQGLNSELFQKIRKDPCTFDWFSSVKDQ